jgi:murein L,D-transpeptidase YcbB/YkuD
MAIPAIPAAPAVAQMDATQELMRGRIEQIHVGMGLEIEGVPIAARHLIPLLYERRDFRPLWLNAAKRDELIALVRDSEQEGLDPDDYHAREIEHYQRRSGSEDSPHFIVDRDIIFTDSLVRLGYHLAFGKVNPENFDSDWNFNRDFGDRDSVGVVEAAIEAPSLRRYVVDFFPRGPLHKSMQDALARYRAIEADGGWQPVPEGPTLRPGDADPRVPLIRDRVAVEFGTETVPTADRALYDPALEESVRAFQRRYGLDVDGVIGKGTLAAMNVPVEDRIDQIRVNLERARWVFNNVEDDFLIVNIAGFRVFLIEQGDVKWTGRAQVGKPYRQTPVFRSTMKYLVFNPTWTVPPTILRKDILPKAIEDPGYLAARNISVLDQSGNVIDVNALDWDSYRSGRFPYILRQGAGPTNALGRVKFIFPNEHFVFLHDTPSRALFERTDRTFSSGCIRVENPLELAAVLLDDPQTWNQESIDRLIQSGETKTVFLKEPLSVLLMYWTAGIGDDGEFMFRKDVYNRDQRILEGLNSDFEFSLPEDLQRQLNAGA